MIYTVQRGDTLWGIAAQQLGHAEQWRDIARLNRLTPTTPLLIGSSLLLPLKKVSGPRPHTIVLNLEAARNGYEKQPATLIPARVYFFVVADELLPAEKVVRRVLVFPERGLQTLNLSPAEVTRYVLHPERYGFTPTDPLSSLPAGRHAMGMKPSPFVSASKLPKGTPRMEGEPFWIDVEKIQKAGVTVHDTDEILRDLDRIQAKTRSAEALLRMERTRQFVTGDQEVLLRGLVPARAVKGAAAMQLTRGFRVLGGVGMVLSAYDLGRAGVSSYQHHSIRPLEAEAIRQAGGWGGALAGAKIGAWVGGLVGIETGPGAVLTAAGGALLFGAVGFFAAGWLEDQFQPQ